MKMSEIVRTEEKCRFGRTAIRRWLFDRQCYRLLNPVWAALGVAFNKVVSVPASTSSFRSIAPL